jgi:Na+/phosphate symporter|tara:strand:+ start:2765 stop:3001 length:237 start_codon:yes stop_codon:yes gene_type:complete
MESNYDKLKSYLNAKYEYLAAMGKHNLSEREGAECEYQWRMMIDIMEYVDKLDEMDALIESLPTGNITLISNAKSQNQ